ncbi:MAG: permease-like cell division protein FtsX [Methylococcales bacterium]|nr:permease-like cell division protein FtsX [Methylococcales bacterium]
MKNKSAPEFSDKSQAYFYIHAQALFSSLGRLVSKPISSLMTILAIATAITLAASFYLFVTNMQQVVGGLESTNQISLYLRDDVTPQEGRKLADDIQKTHDIEKIAFISKEQAMDEFKVYSGFGSALNTLDSNPLPMVVQVLPKGSLDNLRGVEDLMMKLAKYPQVEALKMDMEWVNRLHAIVQVVHRGVFILAVLLAAVILFITGNTIRLELQHRSDEVHVSKLVGATNAFIQRPFLYTGFWLGFIAALFAWIFTVILVVILQEPIGSLSTLYGTTFEISYLSFKDTFKMLGISSLLCIIAAWSVLGYQLSQIKPK